MGIGMRRQGKGRKVTVYDIALTGVMTAVMVVSKEAMSFLPNVEPVSFWVILFTLTYG